MIGFAIGFVVGGICGIFVISMLSINRDYPAKDEDKK